MNRLVALALAFTSTRALILGRRQSFGTNATEGFNRHISNTCSPWDDSGVLDWNAPCNALTAIQYDCHFGPGTKDLIPNREVGEKLEEGDEVTIMQVLESVPDMLPLDAQRACICQSQHNDMLDGCMACAKAHGGNENLHWVSDSRIQDAMETYCDAEFPATVDYIAYYMMYIVPYMDDMPVESTTYSDPIGSATDVSLYFTPSMTGTEAYVPALPTPQSSGGNITFTSTRVSSGQIIPTASGSEVVESSDAASTDVAESGSESATVEAAAMPTAMAQSGAIGVLGLAALVAAL